MPRYFLHICDRVGIHEDTEGRELPNLAAARAAAINEARAILEAELRLGVLDLNSIIEIEDETGKPLMTVPFADAVEIQALAAAGQCADGNVPER